MHPPAPVARIQAGTIAALHAAEALSRNSSWASAGDVAGVIDGAMAGLRIPGDLVVQICEIGGIQGKHAIISDGTFFMLASVPERLHEMIKGSIIHISILGLLPDHGGAQALALHGLTVLQREAPLIGNPVAYDPLLKREIGKRPTLTMHDTLVTAIRCVNDAHQAYMAHQAAKADAAMAALLQEEEEEAAVAALRANVRKKKGKKTSKQRLCATPPVSSDSSSVPSPTPGVHPPPEVDEADMLLLDAFAAIGIQAEGMLTPTSPRPSPTLPQPLEELMCPLTHELMRDPVMLIEHGQTYERVAIECWLLAHNTDPLSGLELQDKTLSPNILVRGMCLKYA